MLSQPYWLADLDCRALASLTLTGLPWQQTNWPWGVEINKNSKAIHKIGSKFRWNPSKLDPFGWCWSSKPRLHGPSNLAEALWVHFHWFLTSQAISSNETPVQFPSAIFLQFNMETCPFIDDFKMIYPWLSWWCSIANSLPRGDILKQSWSQLQVSIFWGPGACPIAGWSIPQMDAPQTRAWFFCLVCHKSSPEGAADVHPRF